MDGDGDDDDDVDDSGDGAQMHAGKNIPITDNAAHRQSLFGSTAFTHRKRIANVWKRRRVIVGKR